MRCKTESWKIDKNGSLVFGSKKDVLNRIYRPKSVFDQPAVAVFVMVMCALLDCTLFYQLLSKALYDSTATMYATTIGLLIGFDFAPCYLGMKMREAKQGYRINRILYVSLASSFALAFAVNFYLRIVMRDLALPDLSTTTSLLGGVSTEQVSNPLAMAFALFAAILPAVTSLCSFGISYAISNPLKKELEYLDKNMERIEADMIRMRSVLRECDTDSDYYERIQMDDEDQYKACVAQIRERALRYADYVRERIKEHIKDNPAGINELSKEQYGHMLSLLEDYSVENVSKAIAAYNPDNMELVDPFAA